MDSNNQVPYIVHEGIVARMERTIRRLWLLCIIVFVAFVVSNALWIYYESQWEVVQETTSTTNQEVNQDSSFGGNSFIGGDYYYGQADSKDQ